ncbi:iron permease [Lysobacter arseniciresistens ZS79]|uniref:Iron permease n=1 Tax=Lysobacter arseniciresistens ZS79 TaxID=913325 RepID=A0A0A0F675_9GAMM|nr:FTR1 family protein [Lysobacter arseniciresistens]KGM57838.1 iron permease [Lysobacter arseniciresistens ZS79]
MTHVLRCLIVSLLLAFALSAHADPGAQTVWRLLDYIAVDYAVAVQDGEVVSEAEYAEMIEFADSVSERVAVLPETGAQAALVDGAAELQAAIAAKQSPEAVAGIARGLAGQLLAAYPMPLAPSSTPDLAKAAAQYQQQCASCHGATGAGDGPAGAGLEPAPIDFTDRERARERSVFALYQVIEQGLEGTGMGSYAHLPADDRWALSFYIGQYAYPDDLVAEGKRLWESDPAVREALPDMATLTQMTPSALADRVGEDAAAALTAYLRRAPDAVAPKPEGSLALARARLAEGVEAYAAGDRTAARDLMLSAYLDGFEPVEPLLAARDRALMGRIETAMAELRSRIGRSAPPAEVQAQVAVINGLFDDAEEALSPDRASDVSSFVGAFTILLREGLEALLIVIAMVAFLRKANRTEVMPYVHAGWVGALLAGAFTWVVATYLVGISGASRELTEGFAALFAAVVLLFVGIWMHGKSQAGAWQRYIREKLSHALSKRSAWFLFLLSFVVVYREVFETVLFYAALWSQGNSSAIVAGAGAAVVVLAAIAWAMLRYSRKLPFSQFFAISSVLIAVLAVMLAGKGIAALQEAGWLPVTVIPFPRIDLLGIHPTLEGVATQLLVLVILVAGFTWNRRAASVLAREPVTDGGS